MSRQIIRRIRLSHCKRGPAVCPKCREMDAERICLLEVFTPGESLAQRRSILVDAEGEAAWLDFDVVRTYDSEAEARAHAAGIGVTDIDLEIRP